MQQQRISSILIANRGEIALRIIRACRELGVESIQAYSEADRDSMAVESADRSVCIGPAHSSKSYLNYKAIVSCALSRGIEAIHPGYGFLAENDQFAYECENAGIKFIGPSSEVIRKMGNKVEARKIAKSAGVPTIPGSDGAVADFDEAMSIAKDIGFPLLVKASAGGGGRGMRVIHRTEDLSSGLSEAMTEAEAAFGNGAVYIEKYLTNIRHIEVQVLSDGVSHIHLGERDCTVQRRNQKLIEEAPSPTISAELRQRLGDYAVKLCKEVDYVSAGTIEYVFDNDSGEVYFIEMNTRIQVEHPVTEFVTGIDLVKEQIRIASGAPLSIKQSDVRWTGHSIECRINCEDPDRDFMPNPGTVTTFVAPGGPGIRVDSHLRAGYKIPPFYDSLVAKVIAWGVDREEAIVRMQRALRELEIGGVTTTQAYHRKILEHEKFRSGHFNTQFISEMAKND